MAGGGRTIFERDEKAVRTEPGAPKRDRRESGRTAEAGKDTAPGKVKEIGGPRGPEPTRYGDWEKGGRCSDF